VSCLSRNTQGVMLIRLASDEKLVGLERVQEPSEEELEAIVELDEEGNPLPVEAESEPQTDADDEQQPLDDQE